MTRSRAPVPALLLSALAGAVVALVWPTSPTGPGVSAIGALVGLAIPTVTALVLLVVLTDRTHRAGDRAQLEGERLAEIMRRVPAAISVQDDSGVFLAVNSALVAHYGAAHAEQIVGHFPRRASLHAVDDDFRRVARDGVAVESVRRSEARDGTESWFSSTLVPFRLDDDRTGVLHVASDVTEMRRVQQRLEEVLTRALADFIPTCASCGRVRMDDDDDAPDSEPDAATTEEWAGLEAYLATHTTTRFSHTFCPDCAARLYGDALPELRPGSPGDPPPSPES